LQNRKEEGSTNQHKAIGNEVTRCKATRQQNNKWGEGVNKIVKSANEAMNDGSKMKHEVTRQGSKVI
jgi:hypothetical protein